ncbi:hypothetical protein MKW92_038025 [Papaver armeniacum]|nr:hypothetical protein MKW92_038025 [Papaver armeniacum]
MVPRVPSVCVGGHSFIFFHPSNSTMVDPKTNVGGGVQDVYGEDRATEDQLVTPRTFSMARPHHNKGLAFSEKDRDAHYLRGLLPPVVLTQELQEKKVMQSLRKYEVPLQRYMAMMDLQERNERLFHKLLIDNVEELLPTVYTPTVGEAFQKSSTIFRRPQGLYISLKEKGKILEVLKNWPEKDIQVIVVTDGERILGLGDLGCQGMGIPVGKLALYAALGGLRPSACLPITIDVVTNNQKLLDNEFYIGLKQKRETVKEYDDLLHEFMSAVKQNYGEKVLVPFEDFANHNAFELLSIHSKSHLESLQHFKKHWAPEHEPVKDLIDAIKALKPTVLIGSSGVGQTFTKEVVEAIASFNEKPIIMALFNPTSQSECTTEQAYTWSEGRDIFASGSPFDPVEYDGKVFVRGQANNAYIFPGLGLGLVMSSAIRLHDDMLLAASEALAGQVSQENFDKGLIYPPFTNIRKISAHIAANVAAKSYELVFFVQFCISSSY